MSKLSPVSFSTDVSVPAGSQFLGTEFRVQVPGRPFNSRRIRTLHLLMGPELKTWTIMKVLPDGTQHILRQSVDAQGAPSPNTFTAVTLTDDDAGGLLMSGDQIQVVTQNATSAMQCRQVHEEVPQ